MNDRQRYYYNELKEKVGHRAEFLSPYVNAIAKMDFRCKLCNYEWTSISAIIKKAANCGNCARRNKKSSKLKDGLAIASEVAAERGGRMLSTKYINNKHLLEWECSEKHTWMAALTSVKDHGQWCLMCKNPPVTIEMLREQARQNGGECLSEKYLGQELEHHWRCDKKHEWWTTPHHVKQGCWCPLCSRSHGERKCEAVLQSMNIEVIPQLRLPVNLKRIYDLSFQYKNKKWIVEYDGKQHFERTVHFHRKDGDFEARQTVDKEKTQQALDDGYNVIRIDYKQENRIYQVLQDALQKNIRCYFSEPTMYEWLFEGPSAVIVPVA
jgi:hypothetical protein